jgi:hypothetical protein
MNHSHNHPMANRVPQSVAGQPDKLHVIAVISNPVRYVSRYELYKKFVEHCATQPLVELHTVELAFGRRPFEITDASNPNHIQLRTYEEIWHKENMINLAVQRLPADWKYVAWIDADVEFQRKDWAAETMQQLQHYMVVQMFQQAIDLGPYGEAFAMHQGFAWSYVSGKPKPERRKPGGYSYPHWHPGYAWAMRREAWDALGGLYDVSILGSGDHLMAWAMIGQGMDWLPTTMSDGYRKSLDDWQTRCDRLLNRDIGYVNGTLVHFFHGKKRDRKYQDRWKILSDAQFDPFVDIKRDWQGLYSLDMDGSARMNKLRDDLRGYFRARNEDSVDME